MSIEKLLSELKSDIDNELKLFFDSKANQIKNQEKQKGMLEEFDILRNFILKSGKRIRPILFYYGYIISGGKNKKEALETSIFIEFIHSYLLIHDDIIDKSDFRHGDFSVHRKYMKLYKDKLTTRNLKHFGESMGIIIGDFAASIGFEILIDSQFSTKLKMRAIDRLNKIIYNTIFGQYLDLRLSIDSKFNECEIIEMQKYKTAKYSIEGPLHLGAILGGADEKLLNSISDFSIPLGIAYQIQDDIIGVFGSKKKTGKSIGDDIKEGKKTILIDRALKKSNDKQRKTLNSILGVRKIGIAQINKAREIIKSTGSLKFSIEKSLRLSRLAKKKIEKSSLNKENKEFLMDLTDFLVKREK